MLIKGGKNPIESIDQEVTETFEKAASFRKMKQLAIFKYR